MNTYCEHLHSYVSHVGSIVNTDIKKIDNGSD